MGGRVEMLARAINDSPIICLQVTSTSDDGHQTGALEHFLLPSYVAMLSIENGPLQSNLIFFLHSR